MKQVEKNYEVFTFFPQINQVKSHWVTEKRDRTPTEKKLYILGWISGTIAVISIISLLLLSFVPNLLAQILCIVGALILFTIGLIIASKCADAYDELIAKNWQSKDKEYEEKAKQVDIKTWAWREAHPIEETARLIIEENNSVELAHIIQEFIKKQ